MIGYYNILAYIGIIIFMVYSGYTVHYYNQIAKEKMEKGTAFCVNGSIHESDISKYQMISFTLLAISSIVFVLKLNHDIFAKCNYEEGKASGLVKHITTNTQLWWTGLVLTIYGLTIYELSTLDRFDKCSEDVTKNGVLIGINATVVAIISLMILIYTYKYFRTGKEPNPIGESIDLGNTESIYNPEASGESNDTTFNYNYNFNYN